MRPIDIKKLNDTTLTIVWDDGSESAFDMKALRRQCPCAECNALRQQPQPENTLKVLSEKEILPDNLTVLQAEIVGRYAIQFMWSDDHHEGIYTFDYLRKLSQADGG